MTWTDTDNGSIIRSAGVCRKRIGLRASMRSRRPPMRFGAARSRLQRRQFSGRSEDNGEYWHLDDAPAHR